MSPRSVGRTQNCGEVDGQVRLDQARAFLEVAELVGTEDDELATPSVATALAVLAGIAAADAACCTVLGRRTRNPPHAARRSASRKDSTVAGSRWEDLTSEFCIQRPSCPASVRICLMLPGV
jgi:hypothetical protein